eukprot:TRINITY_DN6013_c0_g1_i1.p1 TRINITY_DN6013_c0_g1~~TRINITY_DN6013_c0_g1_i1.p1  ORF type:complete len:318 (+),score=81.80 TRINITY_DN6013_c0_g1_i1:84-1037(+)
MLVLEKYADHDGLPSLAPSGVALELFLRKSGIEFECNCCDNPCRSPSGQLPFIRHDDVVLSEYDEIVDFIRKNDYHMDSWCSEQQLGLMKSLSNMVFTHVHTAYLYTLWLKEENFDEVTYPMIAKLHPFPLSLILPRTERQKVKTYLDSLGVFDEAMAIKKADECFKCLSQVLGQQPYFFGQEPTSFDALVFSYMVSLSATELKSLIVNEVVQKHTNLIAFYSRFSETIKTMPHPSQFRAPPATPKSQQGANQTESADASDLSRSRNNKIFLGAAALALLLHNSTRFISQSRNTYYDDDEDEDEDDDYEDEEEDEDE